MKVDQSKLMELAAAEQPKPKKKRRIWVWVLLGVLLCLVLAGSYVAWETRDQWMGMIPGTSYSSDAGYETPEEDLVFDTFE